MKISNLSLKLRDKFFSDIRKEYRKRIWVWITTFKDSWFAGPRFSELTNNTVWSPWFNSRNFKSTRHIWRQKWYLHTFIFWMQTNQGNISCQFIEYFLVEWIRGKRAIITRFQQLLIIFSAGNWQTYTKKMLLKIAQYRWVAHLASCLAPNSRFYFRNSALQMRISQEYEKVNFRKTKCEIFHSNCFCLEIEWCVTCTNFLHVVCVEWSYKREFRNEWRL